MNIRRDPIYIGTDVWKSLQLLAKSYHDDLIEKGNSPNAITTPDFIADQILREVITQKYPQIANLQKQIQKLEDETIKTIRKGSS